MKYLGSSLILLLSLSAAPGSAQDVQATEIDACQTFTLKYEGAKGKEEHCRCVLGHMTAEQRTHFVNDVPALFALPSAEQFDKRPDSIKAYQDADRAGANGDKANSCDASR